MAVQAPDWLVFRGRRRRLFSYPFDQLLHNLPSRPDFRIRDADNNRGYVAHWEIRDDDTLWLTGLQTRAEQEGPDPGLAIVFPNASGPIQAKWVRQRLRSPDGEQLRYEVYGSRYARETYLLVWSGRLVVIEEEDGRTQMRYSGELTNHLEQLCGSEEGAFLRACHNQPHDAAPRLIYADWLDERGDPRADLIRLSERIRNFAPNARSRELVANQDVLARGMTQGLWVEVMGFREFARTGTITGLGLS